MLGIIKIIITIIIVIIIINILSVSHDVETFGGVSFSRLPL